MNSNKGVTFTELIMVVAIIGILAGMAIPGFAFFNGKYQMRQEVENISGLITRSKLSAMRTHQSWRVVFIPASKQYQAEEFDPGTGTYVLKQGPYTLNKKISFGSTAASGPNAAAIPGNGVSFAFDTVTFNTLGSCNAGTVYLKTEKLNAAVRVMAAAGLVSTWYAKGGAWERK